MNKASTFAQQLEVENFKASDAWLVSFKRRNNLSIAEEPPAKKAKVNSEQNEEKSLKRKFFDSFLNDSDENEPQAELQAVAGDKKQRKTTKQSQEYVSSDSDESISAENEKKSKKRERLTFAKKLEIIAMKRKGRKTAAIAKAFKISDSSTQKIIRNAGAIEKMLAKNPNLLHKKSSRSADEPRLKTDDSNPKQRIGNTDESYDLGDTQFVASESTSNSKGDESKNKSVRQGLSYAKKLAIIEMHRTSKSAADIAESFGVPKSTIYRTIQDANVIENLVQENPNLLTRKNARTGDEPRFADLKF